MDDAVMRRFTEMEEQFREQLQAERGRIAELENALARNAQADPQTQTPGTQTNPRSQTPATSQSSEEQNSKVTQATLKTNSAKKNTDFETVDQKKQLPPDQYKEDVTQDKQQTSSLLEPMPNVQPYHTPTPTTTAVHSAKVDPTSVPGAAAITPSDSPHSLVDTTPTPPVRQIIEDINSRAEQKNTAPVRLLPRLLRTLRPPGVLESISPTFSTRHSTRGGVYASTLASASLVYPDESLSVLSSPRVSTTANDASEKPSEHNASGEKFSEQDEHLHLACFSTALELSPDNSQYGGVNGDKIVKHLDGLLENHKNALASAVTNDEIDHAVSQARLDNFFDQKLSRNNDETSSTNLRPLAEPPPPRTYYDQFGGVLSQIYDENGEQIQVYDTYGGEIPSKDHAYGIVNPDRIEDPDAQQDEYNSGQFYEDQNNNDYYENHADNDHYDGHNDDFDDNEYDHYDNNNDNDQRDYDHDGNLDYDGHPSGYDND